MKTNVKNFFKVNIFRIVLLAFMLTISGIMLVHIINMMKYSIANGAGWDDFGLFFFLFVIPVINNIAPIVYTIFSIIAHRKDIYLPYSGGEIVGKCFVTLVEVLLFALFSGFIFMFPSIFGLW